MMQWKKFFLQLRIITIWDGKIHFYYFNFLRPTVVEICIRMLEGADVMSHD